MTRLSVNINKIATLRNARGGDIPNVLQIAVDCQRFGAEGVTVHPRPDERHIRYQDVRDIRPIISTEFNIEGYPSEAFTNLVLDVKPHQVTLVPDPPDAITSNAGWDTKTNKQLLKNVVAKFKNNGIRTSIFVDPDEEMVKHALDTGVDRLELYTEPYATNYFKNRQQAIEPFLKAAQVAKELGLGLNAGHDLNLHNLEFFIKTIPWIKEVSIGHALISDSIYFGLENTIQMYIKRVKLT
ncbi:MAG: pyridoxine 5'-phosphate synthase [Bacteroidales bacterium]